MISSHNSCLYSQQASAITMARVDNNNDGVFDMGLNGPDFEGQVAAGIPGFNLDAADAIPIFHIFTDLSNAPTTNTQLTNTTDSIAGTDVAAVNSIAVDPVSLFTENVSRHRATDGWQRDASWTTNPLSGRISNQNQDQPFLDDFYRADNRYGPRPNYAKYNWVTSTDDGSINTARTDLDYDKQVGDEIISTDPRFSSITNANDGSDGYWERKSIDNGMRIVVGQRLELGNHLGWNASMNSETTDPLYPPNADIGNKRRQRVALRDNLAAVQGMVVYHYNTSDGQFPLACIANTAHPATIETLRKSRTFNHYPETGVVVTDFLRGDGTNGWEFSFPDAIDTETEFSAALETDQPLGIALRNAAYFAGDPNGGSPSFTPRQNATVHPFPYQAMWGDFSILRRIFDEYLDASVATAQTTNTPAIPAWRASSGPGLPPALTSMADRYAAISPADKSSLHSAACTLGLLARNLESVEMEAKAILESTRTDISTLAAGVIEAIDNIDARLDAAYASPLTTEQKATLQLYRQIERDRQAGFLNDNELSTGTTVCNADEFDDATSLTIDQAATLGRVFCTAATAETSKYPSLYYLFPKANHNQTGASTTFAQTGLSEEYIDQAYLTNATNGVNRNVTYAVVGDTGGIANLEETADSGVSSVAFAPRASDATNWSLPVGALTTGVLNPESMEIKVIDGSDDVNVPLSLIDKVIYNGREEMAVRVLDVDLGKLTSETNGSDDYWISDARDSVNGVFYAVREDAAREDSITRPVGFVDPSGNAVATGGTAATWADCDSFTDIFTQACWMRPSRLAADGGPTDPPLSERTDGSLVGISIKPVDYAPDPDRRPYGFRLNAALNGNNGDLSDGNARTWGLTFVTDNTAYIKGEFNPHSSDGNDTIEEFGETLYNNAVGFGGPFYNGRTSVNNNFASGSVDRWRVAEVLADSVSLLSSNFVDGAVEEGFIRSRTGVSTDFVVPGTTTGSRTSFSNQQKPVRDNGQAWANDSSWYRIDGKRGSDAGGDSTIPIWIGRNGETVAWGPPNLNGGTPTVFNSDTANFDLPAERTAGALIDAATPERMNATIISGLVPSRPGQGYGGLHNFPRFLENWNDNNLFIQGAFLQLNFSTASTGPFDIEAWNPGDVPTGTERILYYTPPARRWGYDVALQFAPPGPIAERFVAIGRPRSEHYRELPIDDPYVMSLRCSKFDSDLDDDIDNDDD